MTKFIGGGVFVPMATIRRYADDAEGEPEGCRLIGRGVLVCRDRIVLCFP